MQYTQTHWNGGKVILGKSEIDPAKPLQLLFGFHGAESTPENMLIHGNRLKLDNTVMAFPQGPIDADEGRFSWWKDGPRQKETVEEFLKHCDGLIDRGREHLEKEHPGQEILTSLWGFSQGASAGLVYALLGDRTIHKVASVCGFLPEISQPSADKTRRAEVLGIFGANDNVVPSFLAEHALDEMKGRGHQSVIRETSQGHEVNAENLKEINQFLNA